MKKIFIIITIIIIFTLNIKADQLKPLNFYINHALQKNLSLQEKKIDLILAKKNIEVSYDKFQPSYYYSLNNNLYQDKKNSKNLTIGYNKKLIDGKTLSFSLSGGYLDEDKIYTTSASLGLTIPLLRYNSKYLNTLNVKQKKLIYKQEILNLYSKKQEIIYNVINSYLQLLKSIKELKVNELAKEDAKKFLDITKAKKKEGLIAKPELQRANLRYKQTKSAYINSLYKIKKDYIKLLIYSGFAFDNNSNLDISDINTDYIDSKINYFVYTYFNTKLNKEDIYKLAIKNNPTLKSFKYSFMLNNIDLIIAKEDRKNDLDLKISLNYSNSDTAFISSTGQTSANISLNYQFDFKKIKDYNIEKAKLKKKQLLLNYEDTKRQILSKIYNNLTTLRNQKIQLGILKNSIEVAKSNLQLINESYKEGIKSYLDVLDAQKEFTRVQMQYYTYYYDIFNQLINLYLLTGKDLSEIEL